MNVLKRLAVVGLLGSVTRAEDKVDYAKLLIGKWETTKADPGTVPPGTIIEFTKDGKMIVGVKKADSDMTLEGTYKLEGNKFTTSIKVDGEEKTGVITILSINDKELATEDPEGKKVSLKKTK